MPSPSTPRKYSNRGGTKRTPPQSTDLDIGEALGPYDTNPVREKIRKWQQQGGGVVLEPDVGASSEDEKTPTKEPEPGAREGTESKRRERTRRRRESTKPQNRGEGKRSNNVLNGSTPKKRVVSDSHWRKNRSQPTSASPTPAPSPRDRASRPNSRYDQAKSRFEEHEQTEGSDSTPRTPSKLDAGDGIKVYAGPLKTSETTTAATRDNPDGSEGKAVEDHSSPDTLLEKKKRTKHTGLQQQNSKDKLKGRNRAGSKHLPHDESSPRRRDKTEMPAQVNGFADMEDGQLPSSEQHGIHSRQHPPSKGGILNHVIGGSKKMFSKPEPSPNEPADERPHGSRVEAWLSGTPDPFVEDETPVEMPAPLNSPSLPRAQAKSHSSDPACQAQLLEDIKKNGQPEQNKILRNHEVEHSRPEKDTRKEASSPKTRRARSREQERSPDTGSPRLKRSGAKKRPNSSYDGFKMSSLQDSVGEALQESNMNAPSSSSGSDVPYAEQPPPLTLRKPFPGTGAHKLSTIASVDSLATENNSANHQMDDKGRTASNLKATTLHGQKSDVLDSESRGQFDSNFLSTPANTSLKRRLTKHADLMSVLSIPGGNGRSVRSARSIRTNRSRLATATVGDLLRELSSDESKYMRELRTLVGGVIPVLLTSVLSKTDSAVTAGLFRPLAKDHASTTQPIVHMGVALERLKSIHKRIPLDNPDSLLNWAQNAQKVYSEYLTAWRLGFQDVVVNLAPPEEDDPTPSTHDAQSLWAGMSQDENGDVVNGDGDRVDVAFLMKRPLVRLKYLAKTLKGINTIQPSSKAEEMSMAYQVLVADARRRSNEERARLEDDSAAAIDATRCRDLHSLAVLEHVAVDPKKRVRARDLFDLTLLHSTGQQIDCRCELLLRDNPPETTPGSDLFISEIDDNGRWLLFPPIDYECVSARKGDERGEIIVMVRTEPEEIEKYHELLSFTTEDEQVAHEWVEMLGTDPVPPKINRSLSFLNRIKEQKATVSMEEPEPGFLSATTDRAPTPTEINIPIGEQASSVGKRSRYENSERHKADIRPSPPQNTVRGRARASTTEKRSPRTPVKPQEPGEPRSLNEAMKLAGDGSPGALKRTKAQKKPKHETPSPPSRSSPVDERIPDRSYQQSPEASASGGCSPDRSPASKPDIHTAQVDKKEKCPEKRPIADVPKPQRRRRSLSPVPSMEFPTIPRVRKKEPRVNGSSPSPEISEKPPSEESPRTKRRNGPVASPDKDKRGDGGLLFTEDVPTPPPHRTFAPQSPEPKESESDVPVLSPPTPRHRRTSSPLKHEYEPSTATESSLSDTSTVEHHDVYSSSETSDEDVEEHNVAKQLPPISTHRAKETSEPPSHRTTPADGTLGPSNSASHAPYKTVPAQPSKAAEAVASVYYWDDKGSWEFLHSDECRVVVTPGLIEAYEMVAVHGHPEGSSDQGANGSGDSPLIALELTPLVPIRRGTALDITIRSPPTKRSRVTLGSNIMFRSRNPDQCDKLYGMINHSRINNPTYVALQNARGPYSHQPTMPGRQNSTKPGRLGSWFSWYGGSSKSSYRAASAPTPSLGASESSIGTMASAFSALKKFGANSKMFNVARSTLTSRTGSRQGSLSTSTGSGSNSTPGSNPIEASAAAAGGIGLASAKVRLYSRESASKWRDMGSARLMILPVSPRPSRPGTSSNSNQETAVDQPIPGSGDAANEAFTTSSSAGPPAPAPAPQNPVKSEKRILIRGKKYGEVLLDACLGESCFERVARTGIAVSVWEAYDEVAKEGGVTGGSFKIYMIQMKSEAETAYTFGLVGKLRY